MFIFWSRQWGHQERLQREVFWYVFGRMIIVSLGWEAEGKAIHSVRLSTVYYRWKKISKGWASLSDIRKQGLFEKLRAIKYYWNIRHVKQMELTRYSTNWYLLSTYYGQKTKLEIMLCILLYITHPITLTKWPLFSKDVSRK